MGSKKKLGSPIFVELLGIKELGRLCCALERAPMLVFAFNSKDEVKLAVHLDTYFGNPIFYYVKSDKFGHFLEYRNSAGLEDVRISNSPTFLLYAPIVAVKNIPSTFGLAGEVKGIRKLSSIEVVDLVSLAKISAYRLLFEEAPMPIFAFKSDGGWVAGIFARLDDSDESSIFFYCRLEKEPNGSFIRYSTKASEVSFTDKIEEHGYVYLKVIRLKAPHPLVSKVEQLEL
ncbi:MAG: hypothetical protein QXN08_04740 [Nitrososphaerales archaeon]